MLTPDPTTNNVLTAAACLACARVQAALCRLEATKGGAVHPIRAVPIDMIADAVVRQAGGADVSDAAFDGAVLAVCYRYDPPRPSGDQDRAFT